MYHANYLYLILCTPFIAHMNKINGLLGCIAMLVDMILDIICPYLSLSVGVFYIKILSMELDDLCLIKALAMLGLHACI